MVQGLGLRFSAFFGFSGSFVLRIFGSRVQGRGLYAVGLGLRFGVRGVGFLGGGLQMRLYSICSGMVSLGFILQRLVLKSSDGLTG